MDMIFNQSYSLDYPRSIDNRICIMMFRSLMKKTLNNKKCFWFFRYFVQSVIQIKGGLCSVAKAIIWRAEVDRHAQLFPFPFMLERLLLDEDVYNKSCNKSWSSITTVRDYLAALMTQNNCTLTTLRTCVGTLFFSVISKDWVAIKRNMGTQSGRHPLFPFLLKEI